jgi:hypothetical protein
MKFIKFNIGYTILIYTFVPSNRLQLMQKNPRASAMSSKWSFHWRFDHCGCAG